MRGSNDCLRIFGLDFQLYITDIIVPDVVCCGIKLNFSVKKKKWTLCLIEHAKEVLFCGKVLLWPTFKQAYLNHESV